jgi:NAD-dependent dihydropyrimidine dehydrogenase PreA subunit
MTPGSGEGRVTIDEDECSGCGLCVEICPAGCLVLADGLNRHGVRPARYSGDGCRADGLCSYACPEPGALTILSG